MNHISSITRGFLTWVVCLFLHTAVSAAAPAEPALEEFFKQYLETSFRMQPMTATRLGDHRFDHLLDDLSAAARQRWLDHDRKTLAGLRREFESAQLTSAARVDYQIFEQHLIRSIWLAENTHPYEDDPRVYNEYLNDSVFLLLTQSTLPRDINISNCLARMSQMDRVFQAARENLKNPPKPLLETAIRQNRGAIAFYQEELASIVGRTSQTPALRAAGKRVAGLLDNYQQFLEKDLLPRATGNWRLGKEKFARKLELEFQSDVTADQVLADAEAEFDRVQREMYVVARQLWSRFFPRKPLPVDDAEGRRTTIQLVLEQVARDHSTSATLVSDVRKTVSAIQKFINRGGILDLPDPDRCRVIEMPEFQRGNSTAYMNSPPPLDPRATGYYAVSPPPGTGMCAASTATLRNTIAPCSRCSPFTKPTPVTTCSLNTRTEIPR